jgi:anti-sigma B factor antagonist
LPTTESTTTRALTMSVIGSEAGVLVCLNGRISIDSSPDLRERLLAILDRNVLSTLTIDLAEVSYIDCSGLATLIEALKFTHARKTTLQLRGLHDRPRYLLEVTGLLSLFETNGRINGSSVSKVL